jgi:hypothetical protein
VVIVVSPSNSVESTRTQKTMPPYHNPMPIATQLAVVIATKGRPQAVCRLLKELERQTLPPSTVFLSATDCADVGAALNSRLSVELILGSPGSSIQRNRALDRLQGRYDLVFFFDDDFVPSPQWIERCVRIFQTDRDVAGVCGTVIRDGAASEEVSWEEADRLIREADVADLDDSLVEVTELYGCNMGFRMTVIGARVRFDEHLIAYGWLEDADFSRIAGRAGRLVRSASMIGVHLGIKQGRVPGASFGYAQIVNPWYLRGKGTLSAREAWLNTFKALAINGVKAIWPETFIDRRGRFRGNLIAVCHLLSGICQPQKSAEL